MARRMNPRTNLSPVRNPRPIKVGPCTRTNRLIRVGVPIEVMTAINCSHGRVHETRRRSEWERERERRRRILGPSGIRPDRRNGPRGPGPRIPDSSFPLLLLLSFSPSLLLSFSLSLCSSPSPARRNGRFVSLRAPFLFLLFSRTDVQLGCHKSAIPDGGSGSRNRACKTSVKGVLSDRESMGKQWADSS